MNIKRLATSLALSGALALAMPASAMAQNDVNIDNTGPDSTNTVTIDNNNTTTVNNDQTVDVNNIDNDQTATSGDATVSGNTTGGSANTGNASNEQSFETVISFSGLAAGGPGLGGGGTGGGGTGGGGTGGGGGSSSGGTGGGSLMGVGTGGGLLPDTGASFPIDVSALRRAIAGAAGDDLAAVNRNKGLSVGLLAAAALMSLLGAAGSAVYATKKQQVL